MGGTRFRSKLGGVLDGYEMDGADVGGRAPPPEKPLDLGAGISMVADDLFLINVLPSIVRERGREG